MLDKLGGRKFLLTLLIIAVGTAVQVLSPKGVTTEFTALLIGVATAFGASNAWVSSKAMDAASEGGSEEAQPVVDLSPITAELDQVKANLASLSESAQTHAQSLMIMQQGVDTAQKLAKAAIQSKISL